MWIAAAVVGSNGMVSERWSIVINPQAEQWTHVNELSLADQPAVRNIAPRLSALLKDSVLVAHCSRRTTPTLPHRTYSRLR